MLNNTYALTNTGVTLTKQFDEAGKSHYAVAGKADFEAITGTVSHQSGPKKTKRSMLDITSMFSPSTGTNTGDAEQNRVYIVLQRGAYSPQTVTVNAVKDLFAALSASSYALLYAILNDEL